MVNTRTHTQIIMKTFLCVVAVVLVLLAPLQVKVGPGGGSLLAQSAKDDEFAEFEDDSDEFDFEVSDEVDDECKPAILCVRFPCDFFFFPWLTS